MKRDRSRGAEQVRHGRKNTALDVLIKNRRTAGLVDAAMDFGHFKVRIDFLPDTDEVAVFLQILDAVAHVPVTHLFPD